MWAIECRRKDKRGMAKRNIADNKVNCVLAEFNPPLSD
jgi:hypothetical protein